MKRSQKPDGQTPDMSTMDAIERMLYGNVEDDADLEAELMALQNEISDEPAADPVQTRRPVVNDRRIDDAISKRTPAMNNRPQKALLSKFSGYVCTRYSVHNSLLNSRIPTAGEIDQLTRQMSEEAVVADDDENDESVEFDLDLLRELEAVVGAGFSCGGGADPSPDAAEPPRPPPRRSPVPAPTTPASGDRSSTMSAGNAGEIGVLYSSRHRKCPIV